MNSINNPCRHLGLSQTPAELKKQIENLKCCGNCKHIAYDEQTGELSCENDHYPFRVTGRCDNWTFDGKTREERNNDQS